MRGHNKEKKKSDLGTRQSRSEPVADYSYASNFAILKMNNSIQLCIKGKSFVFALIWFHTLLLTNSMAYETRRFNAAFTRALQ